MKCLLENTTYLEMKLVVDKDVSHGISGHFCAPHLVEIIDKYKAKGYRFLYLDEPPFDILGKDGTLCAYNYEDAIKINEYGEEVMEEEKTEFPTHRLVRRLKVIRDYGHANPDVFILRQLLDEILDELIRYHELKS